MTETHTHAAETVSVYNPMGYPPAITAKTLAPRLDGLDGKTICLLDCRFDNSDNFMTQLQAWFGEHLPKVNTKIMHMSGSWVEDPETLERIQREGDAAIAGVGL